MNTNAGWWYLLPVPGKKTSEDFEYVFPSLSMVFGINKNAIIIYQLKIGCMKKYGNKWYLYQKGYDKIINKVLNPNKCKILVTKMRSFSPMKFIKI